MAPQKRLLIFPSLIKTPHFETDLEIAVDFARNGWDVYGALCRGELFSCMTNPTHDPIDCMTCRSRSSKALRIVKGVVPIRWIHLRKTIVTKCREFFFKSDEELRDYSLNGYQVGNAVFSTISFWLGEHTFDTKKHRLWIEREMNAAFAVIQWLETDVIRIKPDRIIIFNGRFTIQRITVNFCKKFNIEYFTHERAGTLKRYKFLSNAVIHDLNVVKTNIEQIWENAKEDKRTKQKVGEKFFLERTKGISQGWYSFVHRQNAGILPPKFDKTARNIAVFVSSWEEHVTFPQWYGNPVYKDDHEALRAVLSDKRAGDLVFWIRLHPNLSLKGRKQVEMTTALCKRHPNAIIIPPDSKIDSYALAWACDKTVVFGSTIGVETGFLRKPVILIGRAIYEDLEIAYRPENHGEVFEYLLSYNLPPKSLLGAIKYGYWEKMHGRTYRSFVQTDIFKGKFLGQRIDTSWHALALKFFLLLVRRDLSSAFSKHYQSLIRSGNASLFSKTQRLLIRTILKIKNPDS